MSVEKIKSKAFQRAALKSELRRTVGLLCLLGIMMLYVIVRDVATAELNLLFAHILALAVAAAYEALMLALVRRALRKEQEVSPAIWVLNVCIETQLPTLAILLLIESSFVGPYQALVAPAVLLYFLFIVLSTLRLSPTLSLLTGITSAVGYLIITFFVEAKYPRSSAVTMAFPLVVYFIYAGLMLAGGAVAAFVAGQIRNHVFAALREAELQSQLDRVHHDLDTARSIQEGLLPTSSPNLEHFDLAGWNQPADQTGGDYFDWQLLPDGRVAISLGDATGHGIGPALVSASCRAYARANFLAREENDDLLDRLNRLLAADLSANRFVTFAVVFLDPIRSNVKVLSAGHGPILAYAYADDEFENLEAHGIPLGMIAGVPYSQATDRSLASGDMIVLVTDGVYEWENPDGEQFGIPRVESVIREARDCPAEEMISRLRSAVLTFSEGTEQKDDLTVVVLKRRVEPVSLAEIEVEEAVLTQLDESELVWTHTGH
jgi:serine phosphatase RsbU (regulator of sigma subunit)